MEPNFIAMEEKKFEQHPLVEVMVYAPFGEARSMQRAPIAPVYRCWPFSFHFHPPLEKLMFRFRRLFRKLYFPGRCNL